MPKRKPTRLKNFDYSSAGAYFITICIKDRKRILSNIIKPVGVGAFDDPLTPQIQLTEIGKVTEKYLLSSENIPGVKIDRYVIMPDHIHVIIFLYPFSSPTPLYYKSAEKTSSLPIFCACKFSVTNNRENRSVFFNPALSAHSAIPASAVLAAPTMPASPNSLAMRISVLAMCLL